MYVYVCMCVCLYACMHVVSLQICTVCMYVCMYVVEEGRAFKGVWIDMESSLRSLVLEDDKEGSNSISSSTTSTSTSTSTHRDVFSVDKCLVCIEAGLQVGMPRAQ